MSALVSTLESEDVGICGGIADVQSFWHKLGVDDGQCKTGLRMFDAGFGLDQISNAGFWVRAKLARFRIMQLDGVGENWNAGVEVNKIADVGAEVHVWSGEIKILNLRIFSDHVIGCVGVGLRLNIQVCLWDILSFYYLLIYCNHEKFFLQLVMNLYALNFSESKAHFWSYTSVCANLSAWLSVCVWTKTQRETS